MHSSVAEQSMEAWKRYLRRDDSKLVDIFVGQLKVNITIQVQQVNKDICQGYSGCYDIMPSLPRLV